MIKVTTKLITTEPPPRHFVIEMDETNAFILRRILGKESIDSISIKADCNHQQAIEFQDLFNDLRNFEPRLNPSRK